MIIAIFWCKYWHGNTAVKSEFVVKKPQLRNERIIWHVNYLYWTREKGGKTHLMYFEINSYSCLHNVLYSLLDYIVFKNWRGIRLFQNLRLHLRNYDDSVSNSIERWFWKSSFALRILNQCFNFQFRYL